MLEVLCFPFFFYLLSLLFPLEAVKVVGALQAYPCTLTANLHLLSISRLLGISIFQVGINCLAFDLQFLAPVYPLLNVISFFFGIDLCILKCRKRKCLVSEYLLLNFISKIKESCVLMYLYFKKNLLYRRHRMKNVTKNTKSQQYWVSG